MRIKLTRAHCRELTRACNMRGAASRGAELHLCDGLTMRAAAAVVGTSRQAVHQAVTRLRAHALAIGEPCPTCGEPIKRQLTRAHG